MTFYCAFHGFLFVIRPIFAWVGDYTLIYQAYHFTSSMSDKLTVIYASNLGFLVFAFCCLRIGADSMRFREDDAIREERRKLTQIFIWVVAICAPIAIWSMSKNFAVEGNTYDGMALDAATGVTINTKNNGYVSDIQLMAVSLVALIMWLARFKVLSFAPLVVFVLLRAGTGGRGPFIAALVSAGLLYAYDRRMRYPGFRFVLGAVLLGSIFAAIGADRGASVRQLLGIEDEGAFTESSSGRPMLDNMDYANMEYFEYLVYVIPQRSGTYDYFLDNLQIFTEPFPRVIWLQKPVGEPFRRIFLFDYGYPIGMTRSLPGEGWYALGWVGVILWCGLWGAMLGWLYRTYVRGAQSTFQTAAYIVFLPTLVTTFRDGLLLTLVKQTWIYLLPIGVWIVLAKYFGIPGVVQLRAAALAKFRSVRRRPDDGSAPQGSASPAASKSWLPPAVRRRRSMLPRQRGVPAE